MSFIGFIIVSMLSMSEAVQTSTLLEEGFTVEEKLSNEEIASTQGQSGTCKDNLITDAPSTEQEAADGDPSEEVKTREEELKRMFNPIDDSAEEAAETPIVEEESSDERMEETDDEDEPSKALQDEDPGGPRLVSIADLHGDFDHAVHVLKGTGLIEVNSNEFRDIYQEELHGKVKFSKYRGGIKWIGGDATLVQTGDLTDRGTFARDLFKLFADLRGQATAAGGRIINLVGNHDAMDMHGMTHDVSEGDIVEFGGEEAKAKAEALAKAKAEAEAAKANAEKAKAEADAAEAEAAAKAKAEAADKAKAEAEAAWAPYKAKAEENRKAAWAPKGWIGSQILNDFKVFVVVANTLFVHAGLLPSMMGEGRCGDGKGFDALNAQFMSRLEWAANLYQNNKFRYKDQYPCIGTEHSPIWSRAVAEGPEEDICKKVIEVLEQVDARHMVVGHTIQFLGKMTHRCQKRVFLADTAMSKDGYPMFWDGSLGPPYHGSLTYMEFRGDRVIAKQVDPDDEKKQEVQYNEQRAPPADRLHHPWKGGKYKFIPKSVKYFFKAAKHRD